MRTLKEAILRLEPKIDLLHDCLGFGRYAEITTTSDGYFLGRARGDIGFNHFLGRAWGDIGFNDFLGAPSQAAIERTQLLFVRLSPNHQDELIRELMMRRIPPDLFGLLSPDPKN